MNILPDELIDYIFYCSQNKSINMISNYILITNKSKCILKNIAISRIQLWWLIIKKYIDLKNSIIPKLKHYTSIPFISDIPIECVYYAPHIPNGICRFCMSGKDTHKFSEKLINNFYFPLISLN